MADKASPEPNPNWDGTAQKDLGRFFPAHVYLFAVLFIILALITILALVFKRHSTESKHFVKTIMLCAIVLLSISRAVMLFVDPYLSRGDSTIWWTFGCVLVTGLGSTSLTASLAILLYVLYVTAISTQITAGGRQRELGHVVFVVTIVNFVFFITSDVVTVVWKDKGKIMLIVCQTTFACWGIIVSAGFATLTCKLRRNANATFQQGKFDRNMKAEGKKLNRLSLLIGVLSGTSAIFFILKISEAISGMTSDKHSDTWSWWAMQTVLRTLEIVNAAVLLLVFKKGSGKTREFGRSNRTTASEIERPTLTSISMKTITEVG